MNQLQQTKQAFSINTCCH